MDPGIGSPGAVQDNTFVCNAGYGFHEPPLHGNQAGLHLPSGEVGAVIGDYELEISVQKRPFLLMISTAKASVRKAATGNDRSKICELVSYTNAFPDRYCKLAEALPAEILNYPPECCVSPVDETESGKS